MTVIKNKILFLFILLISCCLLAFVIIKAYCISFTHDESFTYLHYVHEPFMDIISMKHAFTNNHILNSLLIKYFEELFGSNEIILRLPNILALIIYLFYAFHFFNRFTPGVVLSFFIILFANPYFIDFFALARGYGLSFAFMLMSIYHLCSYFTSRNNKDVILFNIAALLAVLSNFTMISFYLACLATYNCVILIQGQLRISEKKNIFSLNRINLIFCFITCIILFEPLRRLVKKNMLDFGGKSGFIEDTIGSIIGDMFYRRHIPDWIILLLSYLSAVITLIIFATIIFNYIKKNKVFFQKYNHLVIANLILLMVCTASLLQHYILNNDFIMGRFALFLYPLFILNLGFYIHYLFSQKTALVISTLLTCLLLYNLFINLNTTHCKDWEYDRFTKDAMKQLVTQNNSGKKISLGINWLFEPSTNFYRYTWDLNWLYPTTRNGPEGKFDYYYIFDRDTLQLNSYSKISSYPTEGTLFAKAK